MSRLEKGLVEQRKTMLILVASPLTEDIYRRIGVGELAPYFEIVVADCLAWLVPSERHPTFNERRDEIIRKVKSSKAFETLIQEVSPDFVLDFVGRGPFTKRLQAECRRVNAKYITHHLVPVPADAAAVSPWSSLLSHPAQFLLKALRHVGRRLANNYPEAPDVSLLAGRKSANPWVMSARKIIHTATPAYFELQRARQDSACENINRRDLSKSGYILFVDDCLTLSFDFHLGNFKRIADSNSYFERINAFFDRLERLTGLPVVIAAHPNGREYSHYAAFFQGREVYFDRTALLSCDCSCVLTHYSSAINFAVLLRKPISLLTFDQLQASPQGRIVEVIASSLNRPIYDLMHKDYDCPTLNSLFTAADEVAYAAYEADYIVNTNTPGSNPFENLAVYLSNQGFSQST